MKFLASGQGAFILSKPPAAPATSNDRRGAARLPQGLTGATILQASQHSAGDGVVSELLLGSVVPDRLARCALQLATRFEHDCGTDGAGALPPPDGGLPPPDGGLPPLFWTLLHHRMEPVSCIPKQRHFTQHAATAGGHQHTGWQVLCLYQAGSADSRPPVPGWLRQTCLPSQHLLTGSGSLLTRGCWLRQTETASGSRSGESGGYR